MDLFDRFLQERTCLQGSIISLPHNRARRALLPILQQPTNSVSQKRPPTQHPKAQQLLLSITSRNNPQEEPLAQAIVIFTVEPLFLIWLPITHIERVRHDPRTGLQILQQLRAETHVDLGQKK